GLHRERRRHDRVPVQRVSRYRNCPVSSRAARACDIFLAGVHGRQMPRVVLAYTGGLATSLCIHWLRMKKGLDVVTFTANVGQAATLEPIGERAIELGAEAAHIAD